MINKNLQEIESLISDEEIEKAWGYADFGSGFTKRQIIANGILKYASGYYSGHTLQCILKELGLLTIQLTLTKKGKAYLWASFSNGFSA